MEALDFNRRAQKRQSLQVQGTVTGANLYSIYSVTPQEEERIRHLPVYPYTQTPLQNAQGQVYGIPGLFYPGDPNHPIYTP